MFDILLHLCFLHHLTATGLTVCWAISTMAQLPYVEESKLPLLSTGNLEWLPRLASNELDLPPPTSSDEFDWLPSFSSTELNLLPRFSSAVMSESSLTCLLSLSTKTPKESVTASGKRKIDEPADVVAKWRRPVRRAATAGARRDYLQQLEY